tara:strand:- start:475 stop:666 length:192 start_codon:yes stop_codon:yes gene_type:complete
MTAILALKSNYPSAAGPLFTYYCGLFVLIKFLNALKKRSYSTLVFKVIAAIFLSFTRNKRPSS